MSSFGANGYPLLSIDQAVTNCRDLFNVAIGEEELKKPTSQFVKKFYLDIVTASMNISSDQMVQPPFKFLANFQHPDIAEEGASFMFFTIFLQRFMHSCKVRDFSKNDLSNPKPKRTLNLISALVNYEKFKSNEEPKFDPVFEEKDTLFEHKTLLLNKNKELKQKIDKIKAARNEDEEKIQQLFPIVDRQEKIVGEINRQQASLLKQNQQLKTETAELTSKEAELKVLIANNMEESEKLKGQVVTSPEKFLGDVRRKGDAINACKESIAEKGKKLLEKKSQEESINLLEQNYAQAVRLISSLEEESERLRNLQQQLLDMHDMVTTDDGAIVQTNFRYKNSKRQLTSQNEKLDRLQRTNQKKFSAKNDEFEQRKKNVQSLEDNRRNCLEQISQIKAEFEEVVNTLNEMEDDHASKMDTMGDAYEQLITSINNNCRMLEEGSKNLVFTLSDES